VLNSALKDGDSKAALVDSLKQLIGELDQNS
jgi:hypothetical protein